MMCVEKMVVFILLPKVGHRRPYNKSKTPVLKILTYLNSDTPGHLNHPSTQSFLSTRLPTLLLALATAPSGITSPRLAFLLPSALLSGLAVWAVLVAVLGYASLPPA